ncbi:MAG: hypothetical protein KatS3mg087_0864 [Patescibacteria group bacterium]|nr:MAG: hypothetical protein KatS3mg087_0864 [Patescibacteria group bacterium]
MMLVDKKIAGKFSKEEVRSLFDRAMGSFALIDGLLREDLEENPDGGLLAQKGIVLPRSRGEALEFIAQNS